MTDTVRIPRASLYDLLDAANSFCEDGDLLAGEIRNRVKAMLAASPQGEGSSADAQGWRDIATAPRDGCEIVAYSQDVSGTTGLNPFVSLCAWHPDAGFCTCELREVTHWMPLP